MLSASTIFRSIPQFVLTAVLTIGAAPVAGQDFDSRAYGEFVDIAITPLLGVGVVANSGPLPQVLGSGPPDYTDSASLANVTVDGNVQVGISLALFEALQTGLLEVEVDGSAGTTSAEATVHDLDLSLLEVSILTAALGIDATEVRSTATVDGPCGSLTASGITTLVGATASGAVAQLGGALGVIEASPAPNTVLLDVNVLGGHIRVVLNEQILSGNAVDSLRLQVNAIHVTFTDLPISGLGIINGQVVISHSEARIWQCPDQVASADVSIVKTASPDPVTVGNVLTYTLAVSNGGPDAASDVVVVDELPATVTFVDAVPSQGTCKRVAQEVTCDLGDVASGMGATVIVRVIPQSAGGINNVAEVSASEPDPDPSDNTDDEDSSVQEPPMANADLSVSISDSPDPVTAGQTLSYDLLVHNDGPDAASGSVLVVTLPASVTFTGAVPSQGSCEQNGQVVTCQLGAVASMGNVSADLDVVPGTAGMITTDAEVSSAVDDPNTADNQDSESTTVDAPPGEADLSVSIADSPDPVTAGQQLTYTVDALNGGPDGADGTVLTCQLPAGVSVDDISTTQGSCQQDAQMVTCQLGTLSSAQTETTTIEVVPLSAGPIMISCEVSSIIDDPNTGDNQDTETTTVDAPVMETDLSVAISDAPDPVSVGGTLTYQLQVANAGPDGATGVELTSQLPTGVDFVSATTSQGTCTPSPPAVACSLGSLAAMSSATVTVTVEPQSSGAISYSAQVSGNEPDTNQGNNNDTEGTTVDALPGEADLAVSIVDSPDPVTAGQPLIFTVDTSNGGPDPADDTVLVCHLPTSFSVTDISTTQGSCQQSGQTITCALGALASPGTVTTTIEGVPVVAGPIKTDCDVSSTVADPNSADNQDAETTTVQTPLVQTDLSVVISDSPDPVAVDANYTYLLEVVNDGPDDATSVQLSTTLPAGVDFIAAGSSQGSCVAAPPAVVCSLGSLDSMEAAMATVTVEAQVSGVHTYVAQVSGAEPDTNQANNLDAEETTVEGPPGPPGPGPPGGVPAIPTLSEVGLAALLLALLGMGLTVLRRRREI